IRPQVLLFDEPLSNLDARLRLHMRAELRAIQRALSITAVYVTHDQEEAMAVSDRIALMRQGTIVQVGTAEDLYHRPASSFVAEFIGRVNLLSARVLRLDAAGVEVVVAETRLRVAPVAGDRSFPEVGSTVHLVLRPETLDLVPGAPGPGQEGTLHGVVVSRTFLGEKIEYEVRVGDTSLHVTRYNAAGPDALAPGLSVTLRLPTAGVAMLP